MCKAPFEHLDKASLFYLSVKTVFLVTLATARRVSEVHALSIDSDHLRFSNLDGSLKGTATLMISMFDMKELYEPLIFIPVSSKSVEKYRSYGRLNICKWTLMEAAIL